MRKILLAAAIGVSVLSMPFGALARQPAPGESGITVDPAVVKTAVVRKTTTHRTVRRTWHRRTTHTRTTHHSSSSGASSSSK
jgi:hypothetical protein